MTFKPLGIDENSNFPTRVENKLLSKFVRRFQANTAYTAGEYALNPSGQIVTANANFTSGASYSATNWTVVSSGGTATTDASQLTSGTLPSARIADGSIADAKLTSGTSFTAAERTKLTGIATGATANRTDAAVDTLLAGKVGTADSRLTDARTPTAHATTHAPGGTDDLTTALSASAVPVALGTAAAGGGTGFARQGHVHPTTGLMLTKNNTNVNLSTPLTDSIMNYTIVDDGSSTSSWANRFAISYQTTGGVSHLTGWFNEYGELRVSPGRNNTIPFRIFGAETAAVLATRDVTVPLLQIVDERNARNERCAIYADGHMTLFGDFAPASVTTTGNVTAANIAQKVRCVPTGTTGFASEPDGTLWIEYTP